MKSEKKKGQFSWRAFTSVLLAWSGLVMAVSGIVLYIAPTGRVAHAAVWTFMGLDKEGWGAVHTILSFLFTIFSVLHVVLNWKPLVSYFKDRISRVFRMRREWMSATLISFLFCLLTILAVPPFQSVMDLSDSIKEGWEDRLLKGSDILPHTENFTLEDFARNYRVPEPEIREALVELGAKELPNEITIGDLAETLEISPLQLYQEIMKRVKTSPPQEASAEPPATGTGRLTVRNVAERVGISITLAVERLKTEGISAEPTDKLRDLGDSAKKTPLEIYRIIQAPKEKK